MNRKHGFHAILRSPDAALSPRRILVAGRIQETPRRKPPLDFAAKETSASSRLSLWVSRRKGGQAPKAARMAL
jgi:hypothetical protein